MWTWKERAVIVAVKYASQGRLETLLDTTMEQIKGKGYCNHYAATHERVAQVVFLGKRELSLNQKKSTQRRFRVTYFVVLFPALLILLSFLYK
jgi:hypothetical protein